MKQLMVYKKSGHIDWYKLKDLPSTDFKTHEFIFDRTNLPKNVAVEPWSIYCLNQIWEQNQLPIQDSINRELRI